MFDGHDANGPRADTLKEDPIITDPKPQFVARRSQFFHIAGTVGEVIVDCAQDVQRGLAIDCDEL